jgi:hypothetical protein
VSGLMHVRSSQINVRHAIAANEWRELPDDEGGARL